MPNGAIKAVWGTSVNDFMSGIQIMYELTFDDKATLDYIKKLFTGAGKEKSSVTVCGHGRLYYENGSWDHEYDVGFWTDNDEKEETIGLLRLSLVIENGKLTFADAQVLFTDSKNIL